MMHHIALIMHTPRSVRSSCLNPIVGESSSSDPLSLIFLPPFNEKNPIFVNFTSRPSISSSSTTESSTFPHDPKMKKTEKNKKTDDNKKSKKEIRARRPSAYYSSSSGSNDPQPSPMMKNYVDGKEVVRPRRRGMISCREEVLVPPAPRQLFSYDGSHDDNEVTSPLFYMEHGRRGRMDIRMRGNGKWTFVIEY